MIFKIFRKSFENEEKVDNHNSVSSVTLKVQESMVRDVGKKIVRTNIKNIAKIGAKSGDIVEIVGRRKTVAKILPSYFDKEDLDIIRMDGINRINAGVNIGEYVSIKKAKTRMADIVELIPMDFTISIDQAIVRYFKKKLNGYPLIEGDLITISILGSSLKFRVVKTKPKGPIVVSNNTELIFYELSANEVTKQVLNKFITNLRDEGFNIIHVDDNKNNPLVIAKKNNKIFIAKIVLVTNKNSVIHALGELLYEMKDQNANYILVLGIIDPQRRIIEIPHHVLEKLNLEIREISILS